MIEYWSIPEVYETYSDEAQRPPLELAGGARLRFYNGSWALFTVPDDWSAVRHLVWTAPEIPLKSFAMSAEAFPADIPTKKDVWSYFVDRGWAPNKEVSYAMRRGQKENLEVRFVEPEEAINLLMRWFYWMKTRHPVQATYRHYKKMITHPAYRIQGWYLNQELVGITGFIEQPQGAVLTLLKHLPGHGWLNRAMWGTTLTELLSRYPVVWCGETADKLKRSMGMSSFRLHRMDTVALQKLRPLDFKPRFTYEGNYRTFNGFEYVRQHAHLLG